MKSKVIYNDFGIGMVCSNSRGEKWIELNRKLKKYPKVHDAVMKSELGHLEHKNSVKYDYLIEIKHFRDVIPFALRHPLAGLQALSPYMKSEVDGWGWNPTNIVATLSVTIAACVGVIILR